MRAHAHPALLTAVKKLENYGDFIEKHSPTVKKSGLFFFSSVGLARPEVVHFRHGLLERYCPPEDAKILLLVPQTRSKPFHKAHEFKKVKQVLQRLDKALLANIHVCFYAAPFGLIPLELDEVYPLSQHETALPLDKETIQYVADQVAGYVNRTQYETIVLLNDSQQWNDSVKKACRKACQEKGIRFENVNTKAKRTKNILTRLEMVLRKNLSE
jgi:7-cyano-7-deazaguanine tRNA-ribosyltransferase